ncbi:MAG: hypothetical protein BGO30_08195 [Bacteroidetes bacterium 41-46]|nr:MAG: hypothetical protein BGO30_08195 [Bacteroidetes bacterium 41-46]
MTTIISTRNLLQVEGTFSNIKIKAEIHTEGSDIKRIASGQFYKGELQVGSFQAEESGYVVINIHQNGLANTAEVCTALPLFIADVQSKLSE